MNEEKRYADSYEVIRSFPIGTNEIVIGEDQSKEDLPYMVANFESNGVLARYYNVEGSDDYAEIVEIFGKRVADEAAKIREQNNLVTALYGDLPIKKSDCHPVTYMDDIYNKFVVVDPMSLKREYRYAHCQIVYCIGGFGAYPNSRGSAVMGTDLYTGKSHRYERRNVIGTLEYGELPEWAKVKFHEIKEKEKNEASKGER